MAGFFGLFDYTKPGPGVSKDEPRRKGIFLFFELFFRKFWNLVKMNLLFLVFNIPAIILSMFALGFIFQRTFVPDDPLVELLVRFSLSSFLVCIPVITVGPAQAGFTYIIRNFVREEPTFLWWDFKDSAKTNLKQSLIISILDFIFVILFGVAINFYLSMGGSSVFIYLIVGFLVTVFVIFLMMHLYLYPMLVTFKLKTRDLFKNALIFSMLKFFPNLLILILCFLIVQVTFIYPLIGVFLFCFITISLISFITNFYAYPKLQKYIIDKIPDNSIEESED